MSVFSDTLPFVSSGDNLMGIELGWFVIESIRDDATPLLAKYTILIESI